MFKATDIILFLGRRGCGKSYFAKKTSELFKKKVIIDTFREYSEGVEGFEGFSRKILDDFSKKEIQIIVHFDVESCNDSNELEHILRISYHFSSVLVFIDEINLFSSPHFLPPWLKNCVLTGRHRNLGMIFTTQRPGELHKTILSQAGHIFIGQIHEKNDLNYISSFIGIEPEKIINLKEREFFWFRPGQTTVKVNNDFTLL